MTRILFAGNDAGGNRDLWLTDGTAGGTVELEVAGASPTGLANGINFDVVLLNGKVLFAAPDASNHFNLWVSSGTAGGTAELNVAGAFASGLFYNLGRPQALDPGFMIVAGKALFTGVDAGGLYGLWSTDGTAAGTVELTVAGAATTGLGFDPASLVVLGTKLLFAGNDTSGSRGLWVTDGTAAGTVELAVAGASPTGLANGINFDVVLFNGKVLFAAPDASNHFNLWVTDGTAGGTSELTAAGAFASGLFYNLGHPQALDPGFMAVAGKVLFTGVDAAGLYGLWTTDGTAAGTVELTVAGAATTGLGFDPASIVVLGTKLLFAGNDTSGKRGLWVTDGTAAGTVELAVAGASSTGLANGINFDVTVLNGKVLFAAPDASNHFNLWVSDGTAGGTVELSVAGAFSSGLFYNLGVSQALDPGFMTVAGKVLFTGVDASGLYGLWSTDGTASGTVELSVAGAATTGLGFTPATVVTIPGFSIPRTDFNSDGMSDMLWQSIGGPVAEWQINGTSVTLGAVIGNNPGPSWHVVGSGDFDGDGKSDVLFQNADGQPAVWLMNGTTETFGALIGNNPGAAWHVIGTGDFNGDGKADVLWQNADGQAAIWLMNGTTETFGALVGPNPGPTWHVIGTGDFDGDGKSDLLWQNADGQAGVWLMNGTSVVAEDAVGNNPGPTWHVIGSGDFNGDGKSDILWQNADGRPQIWLMNGGSVIQQALVGNNPGPGWHVLGSGDYNGDGKSDVLFQNTDGQAALWLMNGTTETLGALMGNNPGPGWHLFSG
jgi:ELWxxDGT repeat protein